MDTLSALLFPTTTLESIKHFPLLLPFSPLAYILAVDDEQQSHQDIFIENTFCQAIPPPSLGTDRVKFRQLIRDIETSKVGYASQLGMLTLASLTETNDSLGSPERDILSRLVTDSGKTQNSSSQQQRNQLWNARLILKIAEILDREEEEIAHRLTLLEDSNTALIRQLTGDQADDAEEDDFLREMSGMSREIRPPSRSSIRKRIEAWSQLVSQADMPDFQIWCSPFLDATEYIFDEYERRQHCLPEKILSLALPHFIGANVEQATERILQFRTLCQMDLPSFLDHSLTTLASEQKDQKVSQWSSYIDEHFPISEFGRTSLTLYDMRPFPCSRCVLKNRPEDGLPSGNFLAVLE